MTILINHNYKSLKKNPRNSILFVDEMFNISGLKQNFSKAEYFHILELLKARDTKKKILSFDLNSKKKVFLVSVSKNLKALDVENLGAEFHAFVNYDKNEDFFVSSDNIKSNINNFLGYFLLGVKLKSYEFKF